MVKYFKAKIVKCADDDFWYKDKIGDVILVRFSEECSNHWAIAKNGCSVLASDVQPIAKLSP